ncbi:MAG: DUF1552 domain-containing protein [Acidobacteriia bacterium]|nr:DUF1552 domain-containing protein [Terriglobia bacterium]
MFLAKKRLPRRTILRGMGAAVALPLLDAMIPAATAESASANPIRTGFIYVPHGADMGSWTPRVEGEKLTLSPTLQALAPYQKQLTVITNLKRAGTVQEMHAAAASGWLSGAIPKATEGEDYEVGTTIDQVLARKIGNTTPLPSLEFATEDFTGYVGGCTPGYSCTYMNTISWSSPTTPLPMEINPRTAFERLFGDGGNQTQRLRQLQADRSILDSIVGEARSLQGELGQADRTRVGDYLDNVREIERRIGQAETQRSGEIDLIEKPLGIPDSFEEHAALMFELLAMVYQADLTRVFTFMMSRESSQRTFPEIQVADPWHVVSHHGNQPEKVARAAKINALCVGMLAKFVEKLRTTPDGDGSLLDHTLLFYGSGMGNSNSHATDPLPMLALGGGVGGNRHLVLPEKTEIGNLWLGLAHRYGEPLDRFGKNTGIVEL